MPATATDFELRHQALMRLILIGTAVSTYLFDRDDVVWRFIRDYPERTALERAVFLIATLMIGTGAALCTWAGIHEQEPVAPHARGRHYVGLQNIGNLLYAIGIGSLVPLWGFVILVAGEALRILRLTARQRQGNAASPDSGWDPPPSSQSWSLCFRRQAAKWGLFATMIAFTVTLIDRVADVLACASLLVAIVVNFGEIRRCKVG